MTKSALMTTLAVLFALTTSASAQVSYMPTASEHIGFYLGAHAWRSDASGDFGNTNQRIDFNLKNEQHVNYFLAVNHPYPLLPNAKISRTTLATTGQTTITQAFSFKNKVFAIGDNVDASFQVSYVDYTFYYELYDDKISSVALGLTLRDLNGDVTVSKASDTSDNTCNNPNPSPDLPCYDNTSSSLGQIKTNQIKPMLNIASNIKLPLTDVSIFANADILVMADDTLSDYQVGFSYDLLRSSVGQFKLNLGYRVINMEFENLNSLATELAFKGAFVGAVARF